MNKQTGKSGFQVVCGLSKVENVMKRLSESKL